GRRAGAGAALAPPGAEEAADRDRPRQGEGRRAGRPRALEDAPPRGGRPPPAGRRPGGRDAGPLQNVDPDPAEPGARAPCAAAGSGAAGPRRKHLRQLVRRGHLELVVAAILRRLVGAPAQEDRRVAEPVTLE